MVLRSRLSVLLPAEVINKHRFICSYFELYLVGMYFDQRFYVLLSVFGRKCSFSGLAANYFAQELSYGLNYRNRAYLIAFFYHISSLSSKKLQLKCLCKQENQPNVQDLNFWLSRAQLMSPSETLLVIMSKMILKNLENNRSREKSPSGRKVKHGVLELCLGAAKASQCLSSFKPPHCHLIDEQLWQTSSVDWQWNICLVQI